MSKPIKDFNSEFTFTSPVTIEESKTGKVIISGTLISEGISKNGTYYSIETLEQLVGLSDIPIYVGTGQNNKHTKASGIIGKILKTTFDKIARKVKFIAEITNKAISESVRAGWGISIGGKAKGQFLLDSFGRIITKVKDLILNHVQLLLPSTIRGMDSAMVESVEVQETMIFSQNPPKLSRSQIVAILGAIGELE